MGGCYGYELSGWVGIESDVVSFMESGSEKMMGMSIPFSALSHGLLDEPMMGVGEKLWKQLWLWG